MDPQLNPYTPGSGLRPLEMSGRQQEIDSFDLLIARTTLGRQNRSLMLTGLRGVGKTVLLNASGPRPNGRNGSASSSKAHPGNWVRATSGRSSRANSSPPPASFSAALSLPSSVTLWAASPPSAPGSASPGSTSRSIPSRAGPIQALWTSISRRWSRISAQPEGDAECLRPLHR